MPGIFSGRCHVGFSMGGGTPGRELGEKPAREGRRISFVSLGQSQTFWVISQGGEVCGRLLHKIAIFNSSRSPNGVNWGGGLSVEWGRVAGLKQNLNKRFLHLWLHVG